MRLSYFLHYTQYTHIDREEINNYGVTLPPSQVKKQLNILPIHL